MTRTLLVVIASLFWTPVYAQGPEMMAQMAANPISATARMMLQERSKNMAAAAELMPSDKYSFHPTEPQMTFGQLIAHISQTNEFLCAAISGTPLQAPPTRPTATDPKDVLVKAVKDSFAHCSAALERLTDAQAGEMVTMGTQKFPRVSLIMILIVDWADHYSTEASYLRLNGMVPPSAQAPTAR